eukprot:scpid21548/ scgid7566/ Proline synthase co-transcribed bacterial homolog protein
MKVQYISLLDSRVVQLICVHPFSMEEVSAAACTSVASSAQATAEVSVGDALKSVLDRIQRATKEHKDNRRSLSAPQLVAVSKTKPVELILEAYQAGQRHFGENYVKEFVDKSHNEKLVSLAPDICWHFIGHLQSNKCKQLIGAQGLCVVESISSERLATTLNNACERCNERTEPLQVFVQVNTSGEENKHGCAPPDCVGLARHIIEHCEQLKFCGLMTIGALARSRNQDSSANEDFECLVACREKVSQALSIPTDDIQLSMGMTTDMEQAIKHGSTNVRVGTAIFGSRTYCD